jgi:hypothetical protein
MRKNSGLDGGVLVDGNLCKGACNADKRGQPEPPPCVLEDKPIGLCQCEQNVCFNVERSARLVELRANFQQRHQCSAQPTATRRAWGASLINRLKKSTSTTTWTTSNLELAQAAV